MSPLDNARRYARMNGQWLVLLYIAAVVTLTLYVLAVTGT